VVGNGRTRCAARSSCASKDQVAPTTATGVANADIKLKVSEGNKSPWRDSPKGATAMMITNGNGRTTTKAGPASVGGIRIPEPTD
jgi:hypothetical protein